MRQQVRDLREGVRVDGVFAVHGREMRASRAGEAYLVLELSDSTGRIPAVIFRPSAETVAVRVGEVVAVRGTVTSWRGECRVSVEALRTGVAYRREDLLPSTRREVEELLGYLRYLVDEVSEPHLRAVLAAVFGDEACLARFASCPASRSRHHACVGGLLEHTVDVATLVQQIGQQYPYVDRDLLLTGALLHDVGKVDEFELDASFGYTDAGRLVGHVVLGERRVARLMEKVRAPEALALRLSHLLLSHHGELEWGSPRRPATLEAVILHHVDNLDAKMAGFMAAVSKDRPAEERWTDANNLFRRPLYAPAAAEDEDRAAGDGDEQYCRESPRRGFG